MAQPAGFSVTAQKDGCGGAIHRFAHEAMGSIFEVLIAGEDGRYAQQAAWAAFDELDRLYRELNRFSQNSDVAQINALGEGQSVRVGVAAFECLKAAAQVCAETAGAFDVTIGRLFALWRPEDGAAANPTDGEVDEARKCTGMHLLELREADFSVAVRAGGVMVDLGGIGKGYAVDQMAAVLREWSIGSALVHGGRSSVTALGSPPGQDGWLLSLKDPEMQSQTVLSVRLKDMALGASAVVDQKHIIDPRTGRPADANLAAWAMAPSGTFADALSTAFTVMSSREVEQYCGQHPDVSAMLVTREAGARRMRRFGPWPGA